MQNQWLALFLHDRANNYQLLLRDEAETTARRYAHTVVSYFAEKNAEYQERQIRSVLNDSKKNPPTAILVSPVRESSLLGAMNEAANERIPWIYLCRWSDTVYAVRRDHPDYLAFSVAADHSQIGRLQGKMLALLLTDKHELVYIQGPQGTSSVSRRQSALRRELEHLPGLRWAPYNSDWSTEGGADMMRRWLANFKRGNLPPFAVCAQNDDMAWGARMALVEGGYITRKDRPIIIGCDGLATFGQRLVSEGMLTATIAVPAVSGRALDELFRALNAQVTVSAELNIEVSPYPTLSQLEKLVPSNRVPAISIPSVVSTLPVSYPKPQVTTAPPVRKLSSTPKASTAEVANKLFSATLKQVALSSRMAMATRSNTGTSETTVHDSRLPRTSSSARDLEDWSRSNEGTSASPGGPKKSPDETRGSSAKTWTRRDG